MSAIWQPNPQQSEAISHVYGPMRIMAGAGTGKTGTLTEKIVALVRDGHAEPEQVLALTFTDKAAGELRRRVESGVAAVWTGPQRVNVHTYHAFGARVVTEFGHLLDLPPEPALLTQSEAWILLWRSIGEIPFHFIEIGHLKGTGFGPGGLADMLKLNGRLSDELRTVEDLRNWLQNQTLTDDNEKLGDYLLALEIYARKKREYGAIDFGDQVAMAADLMQRDEVAQILHERYRFVLVDEFQDTNFAQAVMVKALAPDHEGNVTVVGDPNQAIYLFRGAAPDNLDRFVTDDFPGATTIPLSLNYRSRQAILDVANSVWDGEQDEFRGNLVSDRADRGTTPLLVKAAVPNDERSWVADQIAQLVANGDATYGEIAILARSNAVKLEFWKALTQRGIPAFAVGGDSLLGMPEVKEVISWLRAIANRNDNAAFLHVLLAERWGLDERDIYGLNVDTKPEDSLASRIDRLAGTGVVPIGINAFLAELARLTEISYQASLIGLVDAIVEVRQGAYTPAEQRNLRQLGQIVEQFANARFVRPGLSDLVEYLELLDEAGGEEIQHELVDDEEGGVVRIMTVHQAKGLEIPVVFVVRAHGFKGKKHSDLLPIELAHPTSSSPKLEDFSGDDKGYQNAVKRWQQILGSEEARRVFYVALTRAKDRLYVTWSVVPATKNEMTLPDFAAGVIERSIEVEAPQAAPVQLGTLLGDVARKVMVNANLSLDGGDPDTAIRQAFSAAWLDAGGTTESLEVAIESFNRRRDQLLEEWEIVQALERRRIARSGEEVNVAEGMYSYSALATYQHCPHQYYLRYALGLPGKPSSSSSAFGNAFHAMVQRDAELRRRGMPSESDETMVRNLAAAAIEGGSGEAGTGGAATAVANYRASPDAVSEPLQVEQTFTLRLGDAWIRGFIDRVHRLPDGRIEVVDYKTDRHVRSSDEVKAGLQLPIYLLAVRDVFPDLTPLPADAAMFFVRHGTRVEVTYTEDELEAVRQRVTDLVAEMRQVSTAAHSASQQTCRWCEYQDLCRYAVTGPADGPPSD